MNSATFEDLHDYFMSQLVGLQTVLDLRDAVQDESCRDHLQRLQTEIVNVEEVMAKTRQKLDQQREKVQQLQNLNKRFHGLIEKCQYCEKNLPNRLPKPVTETSQKVTVTHVTNQKPVKDKAPPPVSNPPILGKQTNIYFPEIEYLTVDEFDQVPKYLKGRLVYDQINKFIEGMNMAFKSKYELYKKKKTSLNDQNRKRLEKYKQQESKDTKGCYFVVEEDVKIYGSVKVDAVARNILTILRHCCRIREVRGGKVTRYVYLDSY